NDSYLTKYGINITTSTDTLKSSNLSSSLNSTIGYKLTPLTSIQIFGVYNGLMKIPQGEDLPSYFVNVSLQQEFFKKGLKISIKVNDIFNTMRYSGTVIDYNNFYAKYDWWKKRYVLFGITYNFNNYKTENKKNPELEKGGF